MSWRFVFNTNFRVWFDINAAQQGAVAAGYKFFVFNGRVLLTSDQTYTGIDYADLY